MFEKSEINEKEAGLAHFFKKRNTLFFVKIVISSRFTSIAYS